MNKFYSTCAAAFLTCALPILSPAQTFEELPAGLPEQYEGRIQWVDLDADGDLDLIYSGFAEDANEYHTRVYENNAGTFAARTTSLPDLRNGELAWGDFDKDGDPDILLSGLSASGSISALYENTGGFNFTLKASFPGLLNSTLSWFDIDNDDDLDFLIAGVDDNTGTPDPFINKTLVYQNDGATFALLANTNLPPCSQCAMDWADFNNDGRADVVITNVEKNNVHYTELYLNNGNNTFTLDATQSLPQLFNGDVRWGDFDRDGDVDLLLSGVRTDGTITMEVYENNAGHLLWRDDIELYYVGENWHHGTQWVDYNNDGWLDIVVSGRGTSVVDVEYILKFYENLGDGTFQEEEMGVTGLAQSSLDFGDFDNDGDVDMAYMGLTEEGTKTGILENKLNTGAFASNTKPLPPAPAGLSETFYRKDIHLNWSGGSDAQTPTDGLSYNFYLLRGANRVAVSGANLSTGYLMTSGTSNGHSRSARFSDLPEGNYTWAVQSVDGAKAGSSFSTAKAFYQLNGPEAVQTEIVDPTHVKLTWRDNSSLETSYRIDRSIDLNTGFATRGSTAANATTYTDNFAFIPETVYYYRIYAVNATKVSAFDTLLVVIPATPENVTARAIHAERIAITWDDMSEFETAYRIERKLGTAGTFQIVGSVDTDITEFYDHGLTEGTDYVYRVVATTEFGVSAYSDETTITSNFKPRGADLAKQGIEDTDVTFTEQEFADEFTDQDVGDLFMGIYVAALPANGSLKLNTAPVTAGQRILRDDLGNLKYSPGKDDNGTMTFSFYYDDGRDSSDVAYDVVMELVPVNDAPTFTLPAEMTLSEDFAPDVTILPDLTQPANESAQTLTWSITPDLSTVTNINAVFNATTGALTLSPVKDAYGSWQFTITADDGQPTDHAHSATVNVAVESVNDVPFIAAIEDIAVEKAQPIPSISINVADPDNAYEDFTFAFTSDNQAVIKNANLVFKDGVLSIIPEHKVGTAVITVSVSDGEATGTRQFTVEILTITAVERFTPGVDVYPNPVERVLNISVGDNFTPPFKVIVRDALGHEVMRQDMETHQSGVDFTDLKYGVYFMKITSRKGDVLYEGKIVRK